MRIGPYELGGHFTLAPMAGITDAPFRRLCRRFGAALYISEMVTARPLAEGRVEVLLGDGESVVGSAIAEQPSRPGIYRPVVSPQRAGELELRVRIEGPGLDADLALTSYGAATCFDGSPSSRKENWSSSVVAWTRHASGSS